MIFFGKNIIIHVYININQLVKKGFKVKCDISKLALRGTQTKAKYPRWCFCGTINAPINRLYIFMYHLDDYPIFQVAH